MFGRGKQDTIATRVQRGMQLLDKKRPGWHRRVNVLSLDIARGDRCALGQEYGSYSRGQDMLGLGQKDVVRHGFQAQFNLRLRAINFDQEFAELTEEWQRQILARRHSDKMPVG